MTKEQRAEYMRRYRKTHKEKATEQVRRYREAHREQYNAYCREYIKRPGVREKHAEYARKWRQNNLEFARANGRERYRKRTLPQKIAKAISLLEEQGYTITKQAEENTAHE